MEIDYASFRDPDNQVFSHNGRIYRWVYGSSATDITKLLDTPLMRELISKGRVVNTKLVSENELVALSLNASKEGAILLEHETCKFITYPYEWCFLQLKDAALFHLDLQIELIENNWTMKDASAYNIQFNIETGQPHLIDIPSITAYKEGEFWLAQDQFCRQFLYPLLISAKLKLPFNIFYRGDIKGIQAKFLYNLLGVSKYCSPTLFAFLVLPVLLEEKGKGGSRSKNKPVERKLSKLAFISLLKSLRRYIQKLHFGSDEAKTSVWINYTSECTYSEDERALKKEFISKFNRAVKPKRLVDIGCNTGEYPVVSLESGAEFVIGLDFDEASINCAYANAKTKKLSFHPLVFDAMNPSVNCGWYGRERKDIVSRVNADSFVALAITHHLMIAENIPMTVCIEWLLSFASQGIVEFVAKDDPVVIDMLKYRDDIFPDYSIAIFRQLMLKHADIVDEYAVSKTRTLFWVKAK